MCTPLTSRITVLGITKVFEYIVGLPAYDRLVVVALNLLEFSVVTKFCVLRNSVLLFLVKTTRVFKGVNSFPKQIFLKYTRLNKYVLKLIVSE